MSNTHLPVKISQSLTFTASSSSSCASWVPAVLFSSWVCFVGELEDDEISALGRLFSSIGLASGSSDWISWGLLSTVKGNRATDLTSSP